MTILQVCAYAAPYPGNFIASLTLLEKNLRRLGHNTIYAFSESAKDKDWCRAIEGRTKIYYLPVSKARILPKTYNIFKQIYSENNIEITHSHFELYDIPATITAKKSTKIFWHLHDTLERSFIESNFINKILWKLQYSIFSKRAMLLSVSERHRDFVVKLGFNKNQTRYLPNGLYIERIKKVTNMKPEYNFLLFGWDYFRKGVDLALSAGQLITESNFKLVVVGEDVTFNQIDSIENLNFPFLYKQRPVDDINKLYNNTKCFLHISRVEGLSYALLEAVYAGLPIICSNIKENLFAQIFPTVTFVENENIIDIADKMQSILNGNLTFSDEDVECSRRIIEEKYSLDTWCEYIIKQYGI